MLISQKQLKMNNDAESIFFYRENDDYGEFSNFAKYPITINEVLYPTSEHYFQAMKFNDNPQYQEQIRMTGSCTAIKRMGGTRKHKLRADWENVKEDIMMTALRAKFTQYDSLRDLLLSTGDKHLIEHTVNDVYWADGGGGGRGLNRLGVLLVELRNELRVN
jgi:ribA/ribD-fused uncharacterized protein